MTVGNGGIIGPRNAPSLSAASGVWSLREAQRAKAASIWPLPAQYFLNVLTAESLTSGLQLCLDVGDTRSYGGTGQVWTDLSPSTYDWNRGADGSATATDPTFNGIADGGSANEYWSFDGGDYFRPTAGGGGNTFINTIHKDNAAFTLVCWGRLGAHGPSNQYLFGDTSTSAIVGFFWGFASANGRLRFAVYNGSAQVIDATATTLSIPTAGQWYMWAVSVDEAAASGLQYQNGSAHTFNPTYTSPSASNTGGSLTLGGMNSTLPLSNTSRMSFFAAWDRALSQADLDTLFNATREKFGV